MVQSALAGDDMRAMFTIGLAVCLFGCDQAPKATAPAVAAAAPSCACQQQAQAAPAPVVEAPRPHRHHQHRRHSISYEAAWESASSASSYVPTQESGDS